LGEAEKTIVDRGGKERGGEKPPKKFITERGWGGDRGDTFKVKMPIS